MRYKGLSAALILASANLTGCAVVRGIFKAGVFTGVAVLILFVAIIGGAFKLMSGRRGNNPRL